MNPFNIEDATPEVEREARELTEGDASLLTIDEGYAGGLPPCVPKQNAPVIEIARVALPMKALL